MDVWRAGSPTTAHGGGEHDRNPVVVGYDESPEAAQALRWAAGQAAARGVELRVLYAAEPPVPLPWTSGAHLPSASAMQHLAARVASRGAELARTHHPGLTVHGRGAVGSPAAELVSLSQSASLVVVGKGVHTDPLGSLGSVSFALGAHARCPVVVVQGATTPEVGPEHPVVVGVDASRSSMRALTFAARMAELMRADLTVVSAWMSPGHQPWMEAGWADPVQTADLLAAEAEAAAACVRDALALVEDQHPSVHAVGRTPEGRAASALLQESASAGLLVVGSRGHGGFTGLILGSVSRAVLRRADLPVAVVREGSG